jgi:hypothetical protein
VEEGRGGGKICQGREEKICQNLETKAYRQCGGTPIKGGEKRKEI